MNRVVRKAVSRGGKPEPEGLGLSKYGNVKFFIDKAGRILYSPHFIYDGPTLRG
jgi:hypothetical protein